MTTVEDARQLNILIDALETHTASIEADLKAIRSYIEDYNEYLSQQVKELRDE